MRCHACSAESHGGSLFCENCGEQLPTPFDQPGQSGGDAGVAPAADAAVTEVGGPAPDPGGAAPPVSGVPGVFSVPPAMVVPPYQQQTRVDMPYTQLGGQGAAGGMPGHDQGTAGQRFVVPPSGDPQNQVPYLQGGYPSGGPSWPPGPPLWPPPLGQPMDPPLGQPPGPPLGPPRLGPPMGQPKPAFILPGPARGSAMTAVAVDFVLCGTILAGAMLGATIVGLARGAEIATILGRLAWVHALLAVLVVGAYVAGSWLLASRTPGVMIAARIAGVGRVAQRSEGVALLPAAVSALVAALIAGLLAPVPGAAGGGGGPAASHPGTGGDRTSARESRTATPSATSPVPKPSQSVSTADARSQATAVDGLLTLSSASRAKLRDALSVIDACGDVESALSALRAVGTERESQLARASVLAVSALPGGESIRSTLVEALTYSLQADQAFVTWAGNVLDVGCGHDADYDAGVAASGSAQSAKKRFVALWNPVASTYGLASRTESDV